MQKRNIIFFALPLSLFLSCNTSKVKTESPSPSFNIVTPHHLFTICTPDSKNIWVGGYKSTIIHSPDGGKTWQEQISGTSRDICSISFIDINNGWAVGKVGTILHTPDGGETWIAQTSPSNNHLFNVFFVDKDNGWAVGHLATLLHTIDGGKTWVDHHQQARNLLDTQFEKDKDILVLKPKDPTFNAVYAVDPHNVWIVGEYGTILYSSNGGYDWQIQECREIYPVVSEKEWISPVPSLYSVYFKDRHHGWAVGMDGILIHTTDGGKRWTKRTSPLAQEKPTLYKVKVIGDRGWAVGQFGEYMISGDGGINWQKRTGTLRTRLWMRDMDFADDHHGWAAGERGTIVCTADGGESWTMLSGMPLKPSDF